MAFPIKVKEEVLVASARHCCVCNKSKGVKIEVHHILPKEQGGNDTSDNAIPLCFDCHSDAGHYFAKHPKGTKFSPSELKKHKEQWFEKVQNNEIPQKSESLIHARYIIAKDFPLLREVLNRDLSNFPIENILLLENDSMQLMPHILSDTEMRDETIKNIMPFDGDSYKRKFPSAETVHRENHGFKYSYLKRVPEIEDIKSNCAMDGLSNYLIRNNIEPKKIAEIHACLEGECGLATDRPHFAEFYNLRPVYFKYLALTNVTQGYIQLKDLAAKTNDEVLFDKSRFQQIERIAFPKVSIAPNQSVLIPTGAFLSNFEDFRFTEYSSIFGKTPENAFQTIYHGRIEFAKKIEFIGKNYLPLTVEIESESFPIKQSIHEFEFDNLYWIDRNWGYGSCPHLFFRYENGEIIYQGEILDVSPNTIHIETIIIPSNVSNLIIAELEQETTVLDYVKKNELEIIESITLTEGQSIKFNVDHGDRIEIKGCYQTNSSKFQRMPKHKKENLVGNFIDNHAKNVINLLPYHS